MLTQLSLWWFEQLASIVPNHVLSTDVPAEVAGRAVLVRRPRCCRWNAWRAPTSRVEACASMPRTAT